MNTLEVNTLEENKYSKREQNIRDYIKQYCSFYEIELSEKWVKAIIKRIWDEKYLWIIGNFIREIYESKLEESEEKEYDDEIGNIIDLYKENEHLLLRL